MAPYHFKLIDDEEDEDLDEERQPHPDENDNHIRMNRTKRTTNPMSEKVSFAAFSG